MVFGLAQLGAVGKAAHFLSANDVGQLWQQLELHLPSTRSFGSVFLGAIQILSTGINGISFVHLVLISARTLVHSLAICIYFFFVDFEWSHSSFTVYFCKSMCSRLFFICLSTAAEFKQFMTIIIIIIIIMIIIIMSSFENVFKCCCNCGNYVKATCIQS